MNTVVLVAEDERLLSLDKLAQTITNLSFPIRVFPLLVTGKKILKRWALLDTSAVRAFVEKEERIPTVEEFTETLKGQVCTIFLDKTEPPTIPSCFIISTKELHLALYVYGRSMLSENITDIMEGIVKGTRIFFNHACVALTGIRVKNKSGKRSVLSASMYIAAAPYKMPEELSLASKDAYGAEVKRCVCYFENRMFAKIVGKEPLYFAGSGVCVRVEAEASGLVCAVSKAPDVLGIIDTALPYFREQQLSQFLSTVISKYGKHIKIFAEPFRPKEEKDARSRAELPSISSLHLEYEEKRELLQGILELLNTLTFPPADKKHLLLQSLHKMYQEEAKALEKEVQYSEDMLIPPTPPSGITSLQYFLRSQKIQHSQ